jgi:hypothetical protein
MIAFTDKGGNLTVAGTVREWGLFLERLDRANLGQMSDTDKAREIFLVASAVPFKGGPLSKSSV